ncbi:hypothetical protein [Zestomonas carbonaria]|uniref:Uncharacterized protein n=1 Tax=Zestomonas carbonaria TaxID=2762745 RepID=A0A7U7IB65_9GAMM|nr:hypothetical protein [Pseudomonas carbonaria]CAD5109931.1 hypothetical protein PSEWESI4_04247 [Pseudomonas carbonaria]
MAATVHSDPYAILLRKIGYSVGLEFTADRIGNLTSRYLQDRDITTASWHELVTGSKSEGYWGRDQSAEKHIADFFYSLRLIQRTTGDVLALENLDALAIASELLSDEQEKRTAQDFLFLWAILTNDGEIFVNLLLAGFEEQAIKDTLTTMMLNKRMVATEALKGKATEQRINRIITIERQEKNVGSKGSGQSIASLRRTVQLHAELTGRLNSDKNYDIDISEDYLRKVPPRRRDWAVSLGLWEGEIGLTQKGHNFLNSLRQSGYIDGQNRFTYWPMDYELVRSGLRPNIFGEAKGLWNCLVDFSAAFGNAQATSKPEDDQDAMVELIKDMMKVFRSLHVRKIMLRRELPITIAYPVAIALSYAQNHAILDLPAAILAEQKGEQRRVALRQSRRTGGALSIKR